MANRVNSAYLLNDLLREVSRSFFLTLKFLPKKVRPQIGLAYLLARATDTIADTDLIPTADRLKSLQQLQLEIQTPGSSEIEFKEFAAHQANPSEKILLERVHDALSLLHHQTAPGDQKLIREVLDVITSGQALDLVRFSGGTPQKPACLQTDAELDDYTWRVAGCVGEFWTNICVANLGNRRFNLPGGDVARGQDLQWLIAKGISFGKGLQYVNILRDIPADLKNGRCYIPSEALASYGLNPAQLTPPNWPQFKPLYISYLDRANRHLAEGWEYTSGLPRNWMRLRLACAWPLLIGAKTTQKLRSSNVLDGANRVKVSRAEVKKILWQTLLFYPFPRKWSALFSVKG